MALMVGGAFVYVRATLTKDQLVALSNSVEEDDSLAFRLENLDFTTDAPCGATKCFFRLDTDPAMGYLAVPKPLMGNMKEQYKTARYLQRNYDVRHFLLERPHEVTISSELADQLNAHNVYAANPVAHFPDRYSSLTPVVAQRVAAAPDPITLLFRCHWGKYPERRPVREDFFGAVAAVSNYSTFYGRLQHELSHIMQVLHKEAWLSLDFQLLVDVQGRVYCIDCGRGKFKQRYKKSEMRDWLGYCQGESDVLLNQTRVGFKTAM